MPIVAARVADDIVDSEARREDAAVATPTDILRHEGEPENRHIAEIQPYRPGHDDVAEHQLDPI